MQNHADQNDATARTAPGHPVGEVLRPRGVRTFLAWIRDLALSALIAVILVVFVYRR